MIPPGDQFRAGHIPADLYRRLPDGATVHVVIASPVEHRLSVSPVFLLTVACAFTGMAALVYLFTQLAYAAVPFAGLSVGGITVALRRKS